MSAKIYGCLIFSILLSSFNLFAQETNFNQRICKIKDSQERKEAFVKTYKITSLYQKMAKMLKFSRYFPIHNYSTTQDELGLENKIFTLNQDSFYIFKRLIEKLSLEEGNQTLALISEFSQEHLLGAEAINLEVSDISDAAVKYELRDNVLEVFNRALKKVYEPKIKSEIDKSTSLSELEKFFLKQWAFTLLPKAPNYKWTESASSLHDHVWSIFHDSAIFDLPGGTHINSTYLLETIVNDKDPGLHLNLSFSEEIEGEKTELNIALVFTPFSTSIPIKICDFNFPNEKGECDLKDLDKWCDLQNKLVK